MGDSASPHFPLWRLGPSRGLLTPYLAERASGTIVGLRENPQMPMALRTGTFGDSYVVTTDRETEAGSVQ